MTKQIYLSALTLIVTALTTILSCSKTSSPNPTASKPILTTTSSSDVNQTTAQSGGSISSDGGSDVTGRGVCWNTSSNPTTSNNKTTDGSGTGTFISSLTGLTSNTKYYVRAYGTNSAGTAYGNEITFVTKSEDIPDSLYQSIVYKTVATVPSPADTAKGLLKDSLKVSRKIYKNNSDFFSNITNVSAYIQNGFTDFSFGYDDPNKFLPYFTFTPNAFPNVPREFLLNIAYESSSIPGTTYQRPLFLGSHTGNDGMTYFVDNVYPTDAEYPISKTYTNVVFTNKIKVPIPGNFPDTALYGSGHIVGYCIDYYNHTDTLKYKHQWNFTVDFTNLKIDP